MLGYRDIVLVRGVRKEEYSAIRSGKGLIIFDRVQSKIIIEAKNMEPISLKSHNSVVFDINKRTDSITVIHIWWNDSVDNSMSLHKHLKYLSKNIHEEWDGYIPSLHNVGMCRELCETSGFDLDTGITYDRCVVVVKDRSYEVSQYYINENTVMLDAIRANWGEFKGVESKTERYILEASSGNVLLRGKHLEKAPLTNELLWSPDVFDGNRSVLIHIQDIKQRYNSDEATMKQIPSRVRSKIPNEMFTGGFMVVDAEAIITDWRLGHKQLFTIKLCGPLKLMNSVKSFDTEDMELPDDIGDYLFIKVGDNWVELNHAEG
jgi:hypothetical protein